MSAGATAYPDAFAVQFPAGLAPGNEKPYFLGGDANHPVNVWHWENGAGLTDRNSTRLAQWNVQPTDGQELKGSAVYDDGRWWLVIQRDLKTPSDQDVQLDAGRFTPIAFFAWDGHAGDNGLRCSISTWYDFLPAPPTPLRAYVFPPLAILLVGGLQWWGIRKIRK